MEKKTIDKRPDSPVAPIRKRPPASTPEQRENQLVAGAMDLAHRQIQDGTASAQVITHFLKLGSERERLEREKLEAENALLRGKVDALSSAKKVEELYGKALNAMRLYQGLDPEDLDDGDFDDGN